MEEIEKSKMVRTKKVSETNVVHQIMTAMTANTIREIVKTANEEGVKREDIVSLLKENGQFVLVYYK
jgi:DNA-binding transcriptional regulator YhcF (GntR family)